MGFLAFTLFFSGEEKESRKKPNQKQVTGVCGLCGMGFFFFFSEMPRNDLSFRISHFQRGEHFKRGVRRVSPPPPLDPQTDVSSWCYDLLDLMTGALGNQRKCIIDAIPLTLGGR